MLGKRKRQTAIASRRIARIDDEKPDMEPASASDHDVFRRHFESVFEPIPEFQTATSPSPSLADADEVGEPPDEDSEWGGLSESEPGLEPDNAMIQIVEHRADIGAAEDSELQRQQYKAFMSSRPPKEVGRVARTQSAQEVDEEDTSEALNLKHDLDLQRLLKESHLLEQAKASSTLGSHRHKALDMRLQSLGSKGSVFHQEKMPMAHRRGILAKAAAREKGRRKEASENGIILEKAVAKSRTKELRRERAVDVPAVGKFRGGTLMLSKRDVLDIQGQGRSGPRGKLRRP
ncbi:hypothetical protein G647_04775 [Cladophialophora carrionii CBS 160.54]|uniref:Uncharacterized protein n=1 Tax=Cladophialophora carrionii CBS 160.54 TaxID=1279043 RepID=V9D7T7_9EURO|nr:uncharacterized protein G647_04775 [Cladophialophora carrionii CBS 160.54]ETI22979.1 hypothetical protein G647_04775 [Cladophialophora carrionii CBS 160.54]